MTLSSRKPPATSPADDRSAWAKLQRARPDIEWIRESMRPAEFTSGGELTRVVVGNHDEGSTWIGLVRPGREGPLNPAIFAVAQRIGLSLESLERAEDWLFDGVFPLVGAQPRRGMQMLRVQDAETSLVTLLYWNSEEHCFSAWAQPPRARPTEPEPWEDLDTTG